MTHIKINLSFLVGLYLSYCVSFIPQLQAAQEWRLEQMLGRDAKGKRIVRHKPLDDRFRNPWPDELEQEFQARARSILNEQDKIKIAAGNTYFENEKRTYGFLMAQALGQRGMKAVADLQVEDAQAKEWHTVTQGIDYYAAFTLKHQIRKYFYFGDLLEPGYRRRMYEGAKLWTSQDPLRRPHPAFKGNGPGWGPDCKNSWVDIRSTENLFLMRVCSVYLMAEETGNEETRLKYKKILLDYTKALYRVGMGEWDSENYHGHSLPPLCNLYDFSRDPQVKLAAKACLDWMCAIGAVKYYRGSFGGPSKRDYNHAQPFGGSAACMLWVYFGDTPLVNTQFESDEIHLITSGYRPPLAVVELARKRFAKPLELFNSKPGYDATTGLRFDSSPEYLETIFIGESFQLGTLVNGTSAGKSDVNGFKILLRDTAAGSVSVQGIPGPDPEFVGSPLYEAGKITGENRIAQYQNVMIWLVEHPKSPWTFVFPKSLSVRETAEATYVLGDETWIGLRALGTAPLTQDQPALQVLRENEKARFKDHLILTNGIRELPKDAAPGFCGYAIEIGDRKSHGTFEQFQKHVQNAEMDLQDLSEGVVKYKSSDGKWLGFHWNANPLDLGCWRNGTRHDWRKHANFHYTTVLSTAAGPISSPWGSGRLNLQTDGASFQCQVDEHGNVVFSN